MKIFIFPGFIAALYYYLIYFSDLFKKDPRFFVYFFGCTMSVVMTKFLIARVHGLSYNPFWNFCTLLYVVVFINELFSKLGVADMTNYFTGHQLL